MKKIEYGDIESRLRALPLPPPPPGVRARVLAAARRSREAHRWTTPRLRAALAGGAALFAVVFTFDSLASRRQTVRLAALLDGAPSMAVAEESKARQAVADLRDVLGPGGAEFEKRLLARLGNSQRDRLRVLAEELVKENRHESELAQDLY